jgi:hypothetical protein
MTIRINIHYKEASHSHALVRIMKEHADTFQVYPTPLCRLLTVTAKPND